MPGAIQRDLKHALVLNTVTYAEAIGQAIREARGQHTDPIAAVLAVTHGVRLFVGRIIDVRRRTERGDPITTENLRYGFRVTIIGIPCDPKWRTPAGLELGGPRHFGYDNEYVPVEQRFGTPVGASNAARLRNR